MADSQIPHPNSEPEQPRRPHEAPRPFASMPDAGAPGRAGEDGVQQPSAPAADAASAEHEADGQAPAPVAEGGVPHGATAAARNKAVWAGIALLCLAAGIAGSLIGAHGVARNDANRARASFHSSSATIATTVNQTLQHDEDLLLSASTYFAGNPKASRGEFHAWARWLRASSMYPELQELRLVALVPEAELAEFTARVSGRAPAAGASATTSATTFTATPPGSASSASRLAKPRPAPAYPVVPPGSRPEYCLALAGLARGAARHVPSGYDYCAHSPALPTTRSSGAVSYERASVGPAKALGVDAPVYRGAAPPASAAGRRATFVGWVHEVLNPRVVLAQALHGQPVQAAHLGFRAPHARFAFASGTPVQGAQTQTIALREGWTLRTFGAPVVAGVTSDGHAREVLIAGVLLSALLGLLVFVLGIGSGRPPVATVRAPQPQPQPEAGDGEEPLLYDRLTGLPARALMLDLAERLLARVNRQSGLLAGALLIDVDWFKDVNEKLGHEAGDQLLKIVAGRLESVVRAQDTVGRLEGDRFVVLVESAARGARLDSLARRVIESMHKPVELAGFGPSFFVTASIGLAFGHYENPRELLRDAGLALDAAKNGGRDGYTVFNANMHSVIEGRGVLETELNTALQERQFTLLYQPIRDLRDNEVVALEALIRWRHPTQGVLTPADFIPLAEETGLIVPIGRWVLEEACNRAAAWNVAGHRIGISVMVSANQLNRDGFVTDVRRALQQSGIEPALLTLEIAETTIMRDVAVAADRLREVKQLGVSIAIDDFGSGYAYRSDLEQMPLDYLKVDRSCLAASEDEDYRNWLLEAILLFGRDLSLTVIAKGIETQDQLSALQAMGCTMAQGYFVGEPQVLNAVEALLQSRQDSGAAPTTL